VPFIVFLVVWRKRNMGHKHKDGSVYYKMKLRYMVVFKLYATEDCRRPYRETWYDVTSRCKNKEEFQIEKDYIQSRN
jgi:hypothetical protein